MGKLSEQDAVRKHGVVLLPLEARCRQMRLEAGTPSAAGNLLGESR